MILKEHMRTKRTKGKSTYYHVKDTILIKNISLEDFLSHIRTKAELSEYLADKVVRYSRSSNTQEHTHTHTHTHSEEEAATLFILHAVSVPREACGGQLSRGAFLSVTCTTTKSVLLLVGFSFSGRLRYDW